MENHQNRRRKFLIDSRLQGKLIILVVLLIGLVALAGLFPMFYVGQGDYGSTDGAARVTRDIGNIVYVLMIVTIVSLFATVYYGVRISHRIVGPIYAFSRNMNWIREGIYSRDLRLREHDEFQNLSESFNGMQSVLRLRAKQTIDICNKTEINLQELLEALENGQLDAAKAKELIEGLKEELKALRIENENFVS